MAAGVPAAPGDLALSDPAAADVPGPRFSLMENPDPAASWRQPVLECFTSESATASRLTVVNDPDQLFAEPVLRSVLAERGY